MPTYLVTDPDSGRKLKLTGDSPPTEQELVQAFASQPIQSAQPQEEQSQPDFPGASVIEPILAVGSSAIAEPVSGLVSGAAMPFVGAEGASDIQKNTADSLTRTPKTEAGKKGLQNLGELVQYGVDIVNFPIAGLAGLTELLTAQGPEQAAQTIKAIRGEGVGKQLGERVREETGSDALGAIASAVPEAAVSAIGLKAASSVPSLLKPAERAVQRATGRPDIQVFDDAGRFTDDALEQLSEIEGGQALVESAGKQGAVLTVEQAKRYNLFQERGVPALKADVTRSTSDSVAQQEAFKRDGPISKTGALQDKRLIELTEKGIEDTGGVADDLPSANASVFGVVDEVVTTLDGKVSSAYQEAKKVAKGQPRVTLDNLMETVKNSRGKENVTGGVISSLRQTLKNKGLFKKDLDINKRGSRAADAKKLTVAEAEEIRQELNSLFDSVTPSGRRQIRAFKDAIDDDVALAVGEDIFSDARKAKIEFHKTIERGKRDKFDATKGSFLEDVIDNKIPEENIIPKLLRGRDDDFLAFKRFLTEDAGEQGVQAWNNIKAQTLRNALDRGTSTQGVKEGGQGVFNVRLFRNEMKKLKTSKKYNEMFNESERKLIQDIDDIGSFRIPIEKTFSGKGPSAVAVEGVRKEIIRRIPLVGESAAGIIDAVMTKSADKGLLNFTQGTAAALKARP